MQRNAKSKWPSFERSARPGKTLHKPLAIRFTSAIGFRNPQTLENPSGAGELQNRSFVQPSGCGLPARSSPLSLLNSHPLRIGAVKGAPLGAAERTLEGEDRSGIIGGEGKEVEGPPSGRWPPDGLHALLGWFLGPVLV